jgi:carbonic anhydrase
MPAKISAQCMAGCDIETGSIDALDAGSRTFVSLAEHPTTCAVHGESVEAA